MSATALRILLLSLFAVLLAGCASSGGGRLQAAGDAQVLNIALDTRLDWARVHAPREELWTIDGAPLNQLMIISKVKPGEHVFLNARERKSRPDGPWFRAGMRPDEVRDIVLVGLRGGGWANVRASNLRPAKFGKERGILFDLAATPQDGPFYRGLGGAFIADKKLNLVLFMAAEPHYFDKHKAAAQRLIDSIQL